MTLSQYPAFQHPAELHGGSVLQLQAQALSVTCPRYGHLAPECTQTRCANCVQLCRVLSASDGRLSIAEVAGTLNMSAGMCRRLSGDALERGWVRALAEAQPAARPARKAPLAPALERPAEAGANAGAGALLEHLGDMLGPARASELVGEARRMVSGDSEADLLIALELTAAGDHEQSAVRRLQSVLAHQA